MKVSQLAFVIAISLFASSVFAQNTHMGVPAKDMVVLRASCSSVEPNPTCINQMLLERTVGSTYQRILADGTTEPDFKIPLRKILVITDYEWHYGESTVLEWSANAPVSVYIGFDNGAPVAAISQTDLKVTPDDPLTQQGHSFGAAQMTSGFVVSVLPQWTINRKIPGAPDISKRSFSIVIRGYLLDVP